MAEEELEKLDGEQDVPGPMDKLFTIDQGFSTSAGGEKFVKFGTKPVIAVRRSNRNNKGVVPERLTYPVKPPAMETFVKQGAATPRNGPLR